MDKEIELFTNYLLIDKKYSSNTIESYKRDLVKFNIFCNKSINNITENDIKNYLKDLTDNKESKTSIARNISTLRSYYKFLMIEKIVMID